MSKRIANVNPSKDKNVQQLHALSSQNRKEQALKRDIKAQQIAPINKQLAAKFFQGRIASQNKHQSQINGVRAVAVMSVLPSINTNKIKKIDNAHGGMGGRDGRLIDNKRFPLP